MTIKNQTNQQFDVDANVKMVKHKNKWWNITTRKERSEYGQDYQDGDVGTLRDWSNVHPPALPDSDVGTKEGTTVHCRFSKE